MLYKMELKIGDCLECIKQDNLSVVGYIIQIIDEIDDSNKKEYNEFFKKEGGRYLVRDDDYVIKVIKGNSSHKFYTMKEEQLIHYKKISKSKARLYVL